MKKIIKDNTQILIGFIIGAIVFTGLSSLVAYAINASDVSFTPSNNSWQVNDVKGALDDLYTTAERFNGTTLESKILADNTTLTTRTSFGTELSNTDKRGTLYYTNLTEDGTNVYYYAGALVNNWVIFGTCQDASYNCTIGEPLYWRIIRTNTASEGGGVRLLYSGSGSSTSSISITSNAGVKKTPYNTTNAAGQPKYVGFYYSDKDSSIDTIFENTIASNAKNELDAWFSTTLYDKESYINKQTIYCNDRSFDSFSTTDMMLFGPGHRAMYGLISLKCGYKYDGSSYTYTSQNNKILRLNAGLITSDEVVMLGGFVEATSWLFYNSRLQDISNAVTLETSGYENYRIMNDGDYWSTMSPCRTDGGGLGIGGAALIEIVSNNNGAIYPGYPDAGYLWLRPVISLKSNVTVESGNGSVSNPYIIK